jgi:ABC-type uncharacterized transport system substrate-binding protein
MRCRSSACSDPARVLRSLREELGKLGYVEGQNIHFEVRSAQGDLGRLPALAAELARQRVDLLATWMTPTVLAAKAATTEIPIVMLGVADPVGMGIVASLAHPGGNVTGMAGVIPELAGKLVELLKQALPHHARIAALCNTADPFSIPFLAAIESAGKVEGVVISPVRVTAGPELDAAFPEMVRDGIDAVIVQPSLPLLHVANLALRYRLPAASPLRSFAALGGLMAYANADTFHEVALVVDKILKGAKPADLPVQQPTRFRLVINLKTAKALGLTLPAMLLTRADQVIE